MTTLGYHFCIRLTDDRVIAPTTVERRIAARVILRIAERMPLLAFGLADTHLHGESLGDRATAGEIARRIGSSLKRVLRLPVGFGVLPPRPVHDVWHLGNGVRYVNRQPVHHGVGSERWWEGTSLPDLLGLRPCGAFLGERMRRHLPRIRSQAVLGWLGVSALEPGSGTPSEVLEEALAAAAMPTLHGYSAETNGVRSAVMALVRGRLSVAEEARLLGVSSRYITRLRAASPDPALVRAISLGLGLRAAIRRDASETEPEAA